MNNIKESDIRKMLRDYLRLRGWHVHHNLAGLGTYRGISDLTCVKNGRVVFLEVKTPTGRQSEGQAKFQEEITSAGGEYVLASCIEDLQEAEM